MGQSLGWHPCGAAGSELWPTGCPLQMNVIVRLVPPPPGPPQDAAVAGLHPDIAPLQLACPDPALEAAMLESAHRAAAGEAHAAPAPPGLLG